MFCHKVAAITHLVDNALQSLACKGIKATLQLGIRLSALSLLSISGSAVAFQISERR